MQEDVFNYQTIVDVGNDSAIAFETTKYDNNLNLGEENSYSEHKELLYKDFLLNLNIIKENNKNNDIINEEQGNKKDKENIIDNNKNNNPNQEETDVKVPWIKPSVSATDFIANVYTVNTKVSIYDPSQTIKTAIIFEIYKNGKIYMRNQTLYSGNVRLGVLEPDTEYEIVGIYRYVTEDNKTVEVKFIEQKVKTKDISGLKPLSLSFENGRHLLK